MVASLARRFGDLDVAEEAAAEAFATALERWRQGGVPANPGGWLMTTATRKALDRLRRESHRQARHEAAELVTDRTPPPPTGPVADDRLRLIFTCCHPALAMEARVALTLRLLGGLTVAEIAHAFLIPERTVAQRITRAKRKISVAGVPFRVPQETDLQARLDGVLTVLYLIFNEGYFASTGAHAVRDELANEAVRLTRLLHELLPHHGEVRGLLALMLLAQARRPARLSADGRIETLATQDRSLWNRALADEATALLDVSSGLAGPRGRYQVLAAISAVHTHAPSSAETDWARVVDLYDALLDLDPSPVTRLNRAVAVAEVRGPAAALVQLETIDEALAGYHALHLTRAELLRRLGDHEGAARSYARAEELAPNAAERDHIGRRRKTL